MSKYIKITAKVLWWLLLILTLALLCSVLGAKFRGEVPQMFGYSVMQIVSGSMEPEIPVGSYILVKNCDPEEVREGDIISFYSRELSIYGHPNTHRVVEPPIATENGIQYVTKGDSNLVADHATVDEEQLIGVYVGRMDWLTNFVRALDNGLMMVLLMVAQLGTVAAILVPILIKKPENS